MLRYLLAIVISVAQAATPAPHSLRCNGANVDADHTASFAIRETAPTMTWAVPARGQIAYELRLFQLGSADTPLYSTGRLESASPRHQLPKPAEPHLHSGISYRWKVRYWDVSGNVSPFTSAGFHVALLHQAEWHSVDWLTGDKMNRFRADVTVPPGFVAAHLYVCGLGFSRVTVNGATQPQDLTVGDRVLTTAPWSNNAKSNGFSSIDVTKLLVAGSNTIAVELGNGWRDQAPFPVKDPSDVAGYGSSPKVLRAQLVVQLTNGSSAVLSHTGDGLWSGAAGPVMADSVYNGEQYDGRVHREQQHWDLPVFDGALWSAAQKSTLPPQVAYPAAVMWCAAGWCCSDVVCCCCWMLLQ